MIQATIPANDQARLEALYSYNLLDTLPEKVYNNIIKIAAAICDTPVSLISLVDKERCWFKAKLGLVFNEAPRKIAYAAHAINDPHQITVIEDALKDERFCDCPLVLTDPPMRFYAGTPLVNEDGFVLGTLCVIDHVPRRLNKAQLETLATLAKQVVTQFELRRKMQKVEELNHKLELAYEEMKSFSYSVSHDLKTPIRAIRGFSEIILEDFEGELNEEVRSYLERIIDNSDRADEIIKDLLHLAKISRKTLKKSLVDLSGVANQILTASSLPARYSYRVEPNLETTADPALLRLVLENIIGNAIKYSSKSEHPKIIIGSKVEKGETIYFVSDNGVGFPIKRAGRIFEPFQRLHSPKAFEGTGVGLAIVKRIIDKHNGKIWLDSEEGEGTTVYFSL